MDWPLESKSCELAEIVNAMSSDGPQVISRGGQKVAILISCEDYELLCRRKPTFVEHLLSGPVWDDEFIEAVNERDKSPSREIDFDKTAIPLAITLSGALQRQK